MADGTQIGWTDASWPIVAGCAPASPGCDNCWSARLTSGRLAHQPAYAGLAVGGKFTGDVRILPDRLEQPLRWRDPRRIFVCSASDLFHPRVPDGFIAHAFAVMALTRRHTFQVLTKRHARMRSLLGSDTFRQEVAEHATDLIGSRPWRRGQLDLGGQRLAGDSGLGGGWTTTPTPTGNLWTPPWPLPNVWCGVSVEDQHWADTRLMSLMGVPGAVRWASVEPLLDEIDLFTYLRARVNSLDWVVVGGESGPGWRPMEVGWLTAVVDQCRAADVPVYVKQDSGPRAGQQGRIPDRYWVHEYPQAVSHA